jgi:hypothetical protein
MRVYFKDGEASRSGLNRKRKMVYKSRKDNTITILRRHVKQRITDHNRHRGSIFKSAVEYWHQVTPEFKQDLRIYAHLYNVQHNDDKNVGVSGFNIYMKVVCTVPYPLEQVYDISNVFGQTLESWISRGALPKVSTSHQFTASLHP